MARPPRLPTFDYLGTYRYFVTCSVLNRREAFTSDEPVSCAREQIVRTCADCDFEEIAFICMPDHVHGLFEGTSDGSAFVPFMKLLRQRTTIAYKKRYRRKLWQDGYYEHVLRDEEDTREVAFYIIANPVRKGLVEKPEDYPYVWCKYGLDLRWRN
jgi:REP element-mobilizing transposase RayT